MNQPNCMFDLQQLVRSGFTDWRSLGDIYVKQKGDLLLFNYTPAAQYAGRWNWLETVSRGLILDAVTGDIVARPFDKFFNWGEGGRTTDAPLVNVSEKMDGSLGIAYFDKGQWQVATRGSFDSEQAQWATRWLRNKIGKQWEIQLDTLGATMLFEIIYPENRVVVDYGSLSEMLLLAVREGEGEYWTPEQVDRLSHEYGLWRPLSREIQDVAKLTELCATLDANREGFVAEFADGQRFKFKGNAYIELHRLITGLTFKNTLEAVENETVESVRESIPDEFLGKFNEWVEYINMQHMRTCSVVEKAFAKAPKGSRKEFAAWVQQGYRPLAHLFYARLDGREYSSMIYKGMFAP